MTDLVSSPVLSKTIDQADLDSFLTAPQQKSLLRVKTELLHFTDEHMDAHLSYINTIKSKEIDYLLSSLDIIFFCTQFCKINDIVTNNWVPFDLWPAQIEMVKAEQKNKFTVVLKTRQFGATWYYYGARPIWESIFRSNSVSLLYEPTDADAIKQLSSRRVRGMAKRIPEHIMNGVKLLDGNRHEMPFLHPNGDISIMLGLNPEQGRGDSGSYCVVDEADFVPNLNAIFDRVESAVNAGGKMVLVSTSNKEEPNSVYKGIFKKGWYGEKRNLDSENLADAHWEPVFVPWMEHPMRNKAWYQAKMREILGRTGSLDELWANYPSNAEEALAPAQMNKRLPVEHLQQCLLKSPIIETNFDGEIYNPFLKVYKMPDADSIYFIGVDTAEGLDQAGTDNSSVFIVDEDGEDVCNVTGKFDATEAAMLVKDLSKIYGNARALIEDNLHGFHTIKWLELNDCQHILMADEANKKWGWNTNAKSKAALYVTVAELALRKDMKINDPALYDELQSINKDTLKAPRGAHDDRSMAYALAQIGRVRERSFGQLQMYDLKW